MKSEGLGSMSTFERHLASTWYKNKLGLRSVDRRWDGFGGRREEAPRLVAERSFGERIWSIPAQVAPGVIAFGCWDNAVHGVREEDLGDLWAVETGGPVYSSPAVLPGGSFVVGCEDGVLRRISPAGAVEWSFRAGASFHATPTLYPEGGVVYAACYDGTLYALGLDDGRAHWSLATHPEMEEDIYSSPALADGGAVIFGTGCEIVRVDATGKLCFRVEAQGYVDSTPALDLEAGVGLVGSDDRRAYLFDTGSGDLLGSIETGDVVCCSPALSPRGIGCIGSDDQHLYGIELRSGELAWRHDLGCPMRYTAITTAPTGDFLFLGADGDLRLVDSETGRLLWRVATPRGAHSPPLVLPSGRIVLGSHFGSLYVLDWS